LLLYPIVLSIHMTSNKDIPDPIEIGAAPRKMLAPYPLENIDEDIGNIYTLSQQIIARLSEARTINTNLKTEKKQQALERLRFKMDFVGNLMKAALKDYERLLLTK